MSRKGVHDDPASGLCSGYSSIDLSKIDTSSLILSFAKPGAQTRQTVLGVKPQHSAPPPPVPPPAQRTRSARADSDAPLSKDPGLREITIDVRTRCDPAPSPMDTQLQLEVPALLVPAGYAFLALCLALSNLLNPVSTNGVCVLFTPIPMVCLAIHALNVPLSIGVPLLICAWFIPFVCSSWRLSFCLIFFVCLGVLVGAGTRRVSVSVCLVLLLLSMPLAFNPQWTGLESRWGVTLSGFFLALECVLASFGSGRVVYRIKQTTAA
jgi:hypothetical protein